MYSFCTIPPLDLSNVRHFLNDCSRSDPGGFSILSSLGCWAAWYVTVGNKSYTAVLGLNFLNGERKEVNNLYSSGYVIGEGEEGGGLGSGWRALLEDFCSMRHKQFSTFVGVRLL